MLNRNALILILGLWSLAATAQVPVVERSERRGQPVAEAQSQQGGNELLLNLYTQLEALQREVQTLRGMVEEQSYQIRQMQTENRDRYIDVDRRLSELSGGVAAGALPADGTALPAAPQDPLNDPSQGSNNAPAISLGNLRPGGTAPTVGAAPTTGAPAPTGTFDPPVGNSTATAPMPQTGAPVGAELNERDLYNTALNILLEQQPARYEESIAMFQSYIQRFPQGSLLTNAYYWLGEALILVERYDQARDTFTVLINDYPDHPKAPGALLKRGDVYQRMGQRDLAEQDWRTISTRYPEYATEIREAETRLRRR